MIKTSRLTAQQLLTVTGFIALATPAFAQQPTDAQRSAIRSECRSDYIAHCSSVPPGGLESLQCLQNNMSSLSGACKSAVNAVSAAEKPAAPAAQKSEAPAVTPKAEPSAAGSATAPAPPAAIVLRPMRPREVLLVVRSACRVDIRALCGDAEPGGGRLMQCLATNAASLSPACKDVLGQFSASR
ncbi:MAG TPA: cysteine rich repeat-containing protein [Bradyrhizobium sp.]|jgi:hypothetical protein|nr:cysteine rich repeat-containing protein [Bradyrhizobium sp.]